MMVCRSCLLTLTFVISLLVNSHEAFDDVEELQTQTPVGQINTPKPKDKVLLRDVKTLLFYRNKRTTSRRTHSIHQLSCVGGTAGCKLFTPEVVECTNNGFNKQKNDYDWRCKAEISDRVRFNHVEVICEGYEYPEDDYILLGSCGLEFTLDYTDPHDAHQHSYYHQADEHEKAMHQDRVKATAKPRSAAASYVGVLEQLIRRLSENMILIGGFVLGFLCSFLIVKFFTSGNNKKRQQAHNPSTSVMTNKKAC